ncbi:motility-associated protein [Photobacterium kishitanii]|uniref:Flagellar motor stator protein MotA n=1 Tax=Photobacterium kishitanii TaxID=318456 RepID=A0A2T3KMT6_9GAMM|nr:motility-associated protein [Photobacterium kishitanii]PSV01109.1 hypothetical protein C9J27_03560 [Photobacterium kishitanii]
MQVLFSIIFLIACLVGGFSLSGGMLRNLWQPYEIMMLLGSGIGFFVASNSYHGIKMFGTFSIYIFKKPYSAQKFQQQMGLLVRLHELYIKDKKALSIQLEDPFESEIFKEYPKSLNDEAGRKYVCNNLTLLIDEGSSITPFDFEDMLEAEIEQYKKEWLTPYKSANSLVDTFPAIGIAVAVLGIVVSMQFLDADMLILGEHIGAALFGTFFGIFMAYCIFKPISLKFAKFGEEGGLYLSVFKTYLMCMRKGNNPMKSATVTNNDVPPRYKLETKVLRDKITKREL